MYFKLTDKNLKLPWKSLGILGRRGQVEVKWSIEFELIFALIKKIETSGMSTFQIEQGRQEGETFLGASKLSW